MATKTKVEIVISGKSREDMYGFRHNAWLLKKGETHYIVVDLWGPSGCGSPHPYLVKITQGQADRIRGFFNLAEYWDECNSIDPSTISMYCESNSIELKRSDRNASWIYNLEKPGIKGRDELTPA